MNRELKPVLYSHVFFRNILVKKQGAEKIEKGYNSLPVQYDFYHDGIFSDPGGRWDLV
jgi:hypothetical protein